MLQCDAYQKWRYYGANRSAARHPGRPAIVCGTHARRRLLATGNRLYSNSKSRLSFYDSLIVQVAIDLGCNKLYSEDMQAGLKFGTVTIINPLATEK
jgi:hypothetical protein